MARQVIDTVSPIPNTIPQRYGDPPKTAFDKVNLMTAELYEGLALAGSIGDDPPDSPVLGQTWGDTSVSPTMIRRWDGSQWVAIQPMFSELKSGAFLAAQADTRADFTAGLLLRAGPIGGVTPTWPNSSLANTTGVAPGIRWQNQVELNATPTPVVRQIVTHNEVWARLCR